MRLSLVVLGVVLVAAPITAEPARVTVITKDARHSGAFSASELVVNTGKRTTKVPIGEVASVQFGDVDVVRTRQGQRIKGTVSAEGWTLSEGATERPLDRADLRHLVAQVPLGKLRKGQVMDAAGANGMTYHVRVPDKYDPAAGMPALVLLHGSNAYSADYVKGVTQRWPKVAADYVLIGIDGEWPAQKDPDGPPAFNYTYVNFVGKSKYKGFPGTDRESPALVAETLAEIKKQMKLTRVFVAGHSQGGFLVYSCVMNYPDLFAGGIPISAGLIFQCEPTAYEDATIRKQQRRLPIAIVHGDKDPLVAFSIATSAHESFLGDGFPMIRLLVAKGAGHAFISLPVEEAVRWLESMTSDDPAALLKSADRAFDRKDYRDAMAYLDRCKELDKAGKHATAMAALRQKIEQLAAAPAKKLEASTRAANGNGWVPEFEAFRRNFEFTDAAAGVMAEYAKLRKAHEPAAEKLWSEARRAFQQGDKDQGYKLCEQIVSSRYASTYYRYAKQALDERK